MDVFELPAFPAADVFPMMADDELQELAADIKVNGQHEPIVIAKIDGVWMVIDGRNRRAACKIAGVVPETRELNGEDPTAFVLSANIHRRHMTKGQRAMAVAKIYPETEQGKRKTSLETKQVGVSKTNLSFARTVLQYAPDLAANVLTGAASLDGAYKTARERKAAASSEETQLAALREQYPELADKVVEDDLTLPGARAEAAERDARAKAERVDLYAHLAKIHYVHTTMSTLEHVENVIATLDAHPGEFETQERLALKELVEACEAAPRQITALAKLLKERTER